MAKAPPVDRRRQILDAAVRVFARQGFHACRVSDIAREAGVAYGLVYHYFDSKDQVLNELFAERWSLLLVAIEEIDNRPIPPREKLDAVAGFIIDSYRHDPELMKVIIVEVTRAANSFGRTHLPEIRQAYDLIAKIVRGAQDSGAFRDDIDAEFASMWFYGAIEQLLSGWVFELIPGDVDDFDRARLMVVETICGGLETRPANREPIETAPGWFTAGVAAGRRASEVDRLGQRDRQAVDVDRPGRRDRCAGEHRRDAALGRHLAARLRGGPARVTDPGYPPPRPGDDRSVGEMVFDVSERVSTLVREEVELAKTEVTEKVNKLLRGSAVGVAAGVFAFLGLILLMHSIAWLLDDLFFGDSIWIGFLVEAVLFFATAGVAGWIAYKSVKAGSPPTPELAIEEGKRIRQTLEASTTPVASERRRRRATDPGGRSTRAATVSTEPEIYRSGAGEPVARQAAPAPARTSEQIRADIEAQRQELSHSVEALRDRVTELTDWRRQVREHRRELIIGAAIAGFAIGGLMALRRR